MNQNRLTRQGKFNTDLQTKLRIALRTNNLTVFKKLTRNCEIDLEYVYQHPDYKTCLEIAISEADKNNNKIDFVKYLLQCKVEVNRINETYGFAPIHVAVEKGNIKALQALLQDPRTDVNIKFKNRTAFSLAIKKFGSLSNDGKIESMIYKNMVEMLLRAGSDINISVCDNIAVLFFTARKGLKQVVSLMIDYCPADNDNDHRPYLKHSPSDDKCKSECETTENIDVDKLFLHLLSSDQSNFVRDYTRLVNRNQHNNILISSNRSSTMLQLATEMGLEKAVEILLNSGADPNEISSENKDKPIVIACKKGYNNILEMLINNDSTVFELVNGKTILQIMLIEMKTDIVEPNTDYMECLTILLTDPKIKPFINVNHLDFRHNTALHYAAEKEEGEQNAVLVLLRNGACLGIENRFDKLPLQNISPKTLSTYLDECVTDNSVRQNNENYEIHFEYSCLVSPTTFNNKNLQAPLSDAKDCIKRAATVSPDIKTLKFMAENEDFWPLLNHPVITSFLHLKWKQTSSIFYMNIIFYFLFYINLILYLTLGSKESFIILNCIAYIIVTMGLIIVTIRELFQFSVSPKSYIQSLQNWLSISVVVATSCIMFDDTLEASIKQPLSAVAILLCTAEFVLLLRQFPDSSMKIVMLTTVSWNFLKSIGWYCVMIIGFAFSFFILFKKNKIVNQNSTIAVNVSENNEEDPFQDPGNCLFTTVIMFMSEIEMSSINFRTYPVTSHIIFLVFVFMAPMVLLSLLNGLAVSDIQEIKANAKLCSLISRIRLIFYIENSCRYRVWKFIASYLLNSKCIQKVYTRLFAKRSHLLSMHRLIVKPNRDNVIVIPTLFQERHQVHDDSEDIESGKSCFTICRSDKLDQEIVKSAKTLLNSRS